MTISAALAVALASLSEALGERGGSIEHSLERLIGDASVAVPGFQGLSVFVYEGDSRLVISHVTDTMQPDDIRASLHLALPDIGSGLDDQRMDLVLYSASPGSLVDLAADLAWLLDRPLSEITLDGHLDPPDNSDGVAFLQAVSDIDQAIGVLIGRGYLPEEGRNHLETVAANELVDLHSAARALLATLTESDPPSAPDR